MWGRVEFHKSWHCAKLCFKSTLKKGNVYGNLIIKSTDKVSTNITTTRVPRCQCVFVQPTYAIFKVKPEGLSRYNGIFVRPNC